MNGCNRATTQARVAMPAIFPRRKQPRPQRVEGCPPSAAPGAGICEASGPQKRPPPGTHRAGKYGVAYGPPAPGRLIPGSRWIPPSSWPGLLCFLSGRRWRGILGGIFVWLSQSLRGDALSRHAPALTPWDSSSVGRNAHPAEASSPFFPGTPAFSLNHWRGHCAHRAQPPRGHNTFPIGAGPLGGCFLFCLTPTAGLVRVGRVCDGLRVPTHPGPGCDGRGRVKVAA